MAYKFNNSAPGFLKLYVKGLTKIFMVNYHEEHTPGVEYLMTAISKFAERGSRHTCYNVIAPYFTIEPTSILPCNVLGSIAEQRGCAALTTCDEVFQMPFFELGKRMGNDDLPMSDWDVQIVNPRKCGFVLFTAFQHTDDGMASCFQLNELTAEHVVLTRMTAEEIKAHKKREGFINFGHLMWVRGQSNTILHPAEAINIDGMYGVTIVHSGKEPLGFCELFKNIPDANELASVVIELRCNPPAYWETDKSPT